MDVVEIYDHYYYDRPARVFSTGCAFTVCRESILYRRLAAADPRDAAVDVLEYMLYNVSNETGLPSYYCCCMSYDGGHVCNAIPLMIGSKLEKRVVLLLCSMLGLDAGALYDADYYHKVFAGAFLVNGTFYYSVFRESNNNKVCHNKKSKFRGAETVCYFYDIKYNRGIKLFTKADGGGALYVNDRDGREIADVNENTLKQLYKECLSRPELYTLDTRLVRGFFAAVERQGLSGIDGFKNKIYTNYTIGLNTFLDKLHPSAMTHPMWNTSLMMGKINLGISQRLSYPKTKSEVKKQNEQKLKMCTGGTSTGYLVETQRRRNTRKMTRARGARRPEAAAAATQPSKSPLGSNEVKTVGLIEKLENGERNGPSTFNQVSVSYIPLIKVLSCTVQKLQAEHVHAESSKTVPEDASGFICMKYVGNISTAGKNMLFTDRVRVSYGHVRRVVARVELALETAAAARLVGARRRPLERGALHVVINNAVTEYAVAGDRVVDLMIHVKARAHRFAWLKVVADYACVYFYEGVPLLAARADEYAYRLLYERRTTAVGAAALRETDEICLSRHEMELLCDPSGRASSTCETNRLINRCFRKLAVADYAPFAYERATDDDYAASVDDRQSVLSKHTDQFTEFTPPSKRSVSVNARKSACINVYYKRAADLVRGFNIFTDPDAYEAKVAERNLARHDVPGRVTASAFAAMRGDATNCPQPQYADPSLDNFYLLRTIFADIRGHNVEDANVLDASVDLCLTFAYSFSLTFVDRTARGVDVVVPDARGCARICAWDEDGRPTAVLFLLCTVHKDPADGDDIHFPPFRKVSVIKDADGSYRVYMLRNDAVLIRAVRALAGSAAAAEVVPADALVSLRTTVSRFRANATDRVVVVDFRASGTADKYDGIKVVNSFGQKGLALVKDLREYVRPCADPRSLAHCPVQLVMNVCSFVSRRPIGQHMQMSRNFRQETTSAAGEPCTSGFCAVFFTEGEPTTKTCLVRLDEMMRSVIITAGLSCFQNMKASTDNVYNPNGVMCPPQTRQILDLYRCYGAAYRIDGDEYSPYATRDEVTRLFDLYEACASRLRALDTARSRGRAVLDVCEYARDVGAHEKLRRVCRFDAATGETVIALDARADEERGEYVIDTHDGSTGADTRTRLVGDPNEIFRYIDESGGALERLVGSNPSV